MRYLVEARLKQERAADLLRAIESGTLGQGSIAADGFLSCMEEARLVGKGQVKWIEVCFCPEPLQEERPYWEEYFELVKIKDAHARHRCRDENGTEAWACMDCDCTAKLEKHVSREGAGFLKLLRESVGRNLAPNCSG